MPKLISRVLSLFLLLATSAAPSSALAQEAAKNVQQTQSAHTALRNEDVLSLVEAGVSAEVVIAKIANSASNFDTSPEALRRLKERGVPDVVVVQMLLATAASRSTTPATTAVSPVKIPPGTPVELEAAFTFDSQRVRKGDRISFRVVNPVLVDGRVVIGVGATATARVTQAERGGHFGRAGRLAWSMEEVTAVDGTRVPLQMASRLVGDSKGAKVATQVVVTGLLLWPIAPIALLHGLKRGENAVLPAGTRLEAFIFSDAKPAVETSKTRQ
ncbi:MAG TPA: hypothetical protein VGV59_00465 [Pyrinomonadaceae bacterium]|nr:hypothetical protein [Pyrinomonadaceae bacterium]